MARFTRTMCDNCHREIPVRHRDYKGHWRLGWKTGKRDGSPMWDLCSHECVEDKLREWLHKQEMEEAE